MILLATNKVGIWGGFKLILLVQHYLYSGLGAISQPAQGPDSHRAA